MIRLFLLLFIPYSLFAALLFNNNYTRDINILKAFDISPSFLYDKKLNQMETIEKKKYKRKHFFQAMDDAYIFIPRIKEILSQYGIPPEFLYLAMAESNFASNAYSNKRAVGMWQFMPGTAKLYDLRVDRYVDERRDLIKSTEAAAKYLTYLHEKFGKWYLAAIAYNCGGGYLNTAIRRAGTDKLSALLNPRKHYIPLESRLYIRKILALALVGNDEAHLLHNEYDFLLNRGNAYSLATVKVGPGASLTRISKIVGIPLAELHKLNRNLRYDFVPPYVKSYNIYIPYIKLAEFKRKYRPAKLRHIYEVHIVRAGDTLSRISKEYHVPYHIIKDFNGLRSNILSIRQHLVIPIPLRHYKRKYTHHVEQHRYYRVRRGDTLALIAKKNNISIELLKSKNHLKSNMIQIGEKLSIE